MFSGPQTWVLVVAPLVFSNLGLTFIIKQKVKGDFMEQTAIKEFEMQYQTFSENISKFSEAGNKAAGTRARKALAEIGKLAKSIRKQIQEAKNNESKA